MSRQERMVCLDDFERHAQEVLPRNALDYYRSGADGEHSLRDNRDAFNRYKLIPRVLRNVSDRDVSTSILGHTISFPVCVASTAMHRMADPDGEVATARGAESMGTAFTLSTIATSSIEQIAEGAPGVLRFFQVYIYKERHITEQLVARAENHGFTAIILTVDTPFFGKRLADNRNKFKLPPHLKMANFENLDFKGYGVGQSKKESGLNEYAASLFDPSLTWEDIRWLKSITKLPLVIKGILSPEDAAIAVNCGVDGIVVSNHGARQLDSVPATIDALPDVVRAVGGRCEVYMDGGIRCGADVLKALALGAKATFIGRPAIYGVAYNGADGVRQVLQILKDEFSTAMAMTGCSFVKQIKKDLVVHQTYFSSRL